MEGKELLEFIKVKVEELKDKTGLDESYIHITVSKEANEKILREYLGEEYDIIGISKLYGCQYHVSPFITNSSNGSNGSNGSSIGAVIGLFNYAQMLGQWNTFTDNGRKYDLSDLLNNYFIVCM